MAHTKLIKENAAPSNAAYIGIKQGNSIAGRIAIAGSNLAQNRGTKLFSFGLLSDIHLTTNNSQEYYLNSEAKFRKVLDFLKNKVNYVTICGDLTVSSNVSEFSLFNSIRQAYASSFPIYCCAGNHDFGYSTETCWGATDGNGVVRNDAFWQTYTGMSGVNTYVEITASNGQKYAFVFLSNKEAWTRAAANVGDYNKWYPNFYNPEVDIYDPNNSKAQWLSTTLNNLSTDKCFVFVHVPIPDFCGDFGYNYSTNSVLLNKNATYIKTLSQQHKDHAIFFHGHTHSAWELQGESCNNASAKAELILRGIGQDVTPPDKGTNRDANIYPVDGASKTTAWHVHVPSANSAAGYGGYPFANGGGSQFAIVDVYDNGIEIKGCGFRCNPSTGAITSEVKFIPIANYFLSF